METLLVSGFPSTQSIVPLTCRKPPSCFPVTFEPVNSIFELSGVSGSASPLIAVAALFAFGADVTACGRLADGSSHAAANKAAPMIAIVKNLISFILLKAFYQNQISSCWNDESGRNANIFAPGPIHL
jgi:hypothetical protein